METTTQDGLVIVSSDPQPVVEVDDEGAPLPEQEDGSPAESPPAPEAPEEDDKPLSGKQFQRFVDRQTRQTRELERKLAERDGQIDMLMKMARGDVPQQPPEPQGPPRRPRQSEFATWDEYEAADNTFIRQAIAYEQEQQTAQQRQQSFAQQQQELERERLKAIETREQEVRRQHPDYDDRLQTLLPTITQGVLDALKMSGADGPDLVLYLASHADDVQRLNNMPWHDLGRELGKLAGSQSRRRNGQTSAPNRLPEPPQPVGGGGATATQGYSDQMTQDQYDAWVKRMFPEMPYTKRR